VQQGKVSRAAAEADYGVVLDGPEEDPIAHLQATTLLRAEMATSRGVPPMFDRGPGYPVLAGGATSADVDT
jgi:N-methylhydantoinase B